jgi:hypothetical protein
MVLWFSDQALAVVATLHARLHELEQASEGMAVGFPAFVGKLAGVAGRLAVILHVVNHVETDFPYRIDTDVAEAVQTLVLGCLGGGAQRGFALMLIGGCLIECGVLDPGDEPFDYLFPDSPGTLRFQQRTEPAPSRPTVRVAGVLAAHAGRLVIAHG